MRETMRATDHKKKEVAPPPQAHVLVTCKLKGFS